MALEDIQLSVERRLGDTLTNLSVTDNNFHSYLNESYIALIKRLKQNGAVEDLKHFMKKAASQVVLTGVTATAVDPTIFTKASHGLVDGDIVELTGFTEMTEINGMTGTVNEINSSTFEVNGIAADPAETTGGIVTKITSGTLTSNDVALSGILSLDTDLFMVLRYHGTKSRYYNCREISIAQEGEAQDVYSAVYATKQSPVYMFTDSDNIRVLPIPTTTDYVTYYYLPVLASGVDVDSVMFDTDWVNFPDMFYLPLVYQVTHNVAMGASLDLLKDWFGITYEIPVIPTAPTLSHAIYSEYDLPTAPVYSPSLAAPDFAKIDTFLNDDDYEMTSVAVQKAQIQLTQYGSDITESAQKFQSEVSEYNAIIAKRLKDSEGHIAAEISAVQNTIARYAQQIQAYAGQVQLLVAKNQDKSQQYVARSQKLFEISVEYSRKFDMFMLSRLPQPGEGAQQQAQGGQNAG